MASIPIASAEGAAAGFLTPITYPLAEDATIMGRSDVIRSVSGPDRVEWARNEGMRLHDFGDVQVVTGVLHLRGRGKQGPFDRRYQFTDTWQRRGGRWQIVAAQDYLIPK